MSEDHIRPDIDPPPRTSRSNQANVAESSNQSRRGSSQLLRKLKDGSIKSFLNAPSKHATPPLRSTTSELKGLHRVSKSRGAQDTSHFHPSNDNKHPTTSEIPSDSVNKGLSGEPASQVQAGPSDEEGRPDPQLVYAELQGACDGTQHMRSLRKHATSMTSAVDNAPADLTAADGFETTYLQPLKIIDAVLEKITDVHPYAHAALSVLSAASKIIIAQAQRDESILRLPKKLAEVYRFMTQDDSLEKFESMSSIVGKIVHQTLECARFIGDYSQTTSFWKRTGKNVISETDDMITQYSDALDGLMQQFRDQVDWDVAVFVHHAGETLDFEDIAYAKGAGLDTMKQCLPRTRMEILSKITDWINGSGDAATHVFMM